MSSGFVSEVELEERKRKRQEEWLRVRNSDQPLECPEEEYDHRSLFDRLKEQKDKKQLEYEEAHKLKNMIRGLDDDEVDFLEFVDNQKMAEERRINFEEAKEMADFRNKVANLQEDLVEYRMKNEIRKPNAVKNLNITSGKSSQSKLLAKAVVRKKPANEDNSTLNGVSDAKKLKLEKENPENSVKDDGKEAELSTNTKFDTRQFKVGSLICVGILPGLGNYEESSDEASDDSTDVEITDHPIKYDLLGRKISKQAAKIVEQSEK